MKATKKKTRAERMKEPLKPGHVFGTNGMQIRAPQGSPAALPYTVENGVCMRCEAPGLIVVPNDDPKSVGLGAHASLCPELCEKRPWRCPKCEGLKVPEHARWCEVDTPGYRKQWEQDRASFNGQMLRLATMIAARGERLPAFLMNLLFDRDDPSGERLMYHGRQVQP